VHIYEQFLQLTASLGFGLGLLLYVFLSVLTVAILFFVFALVVLSLDYSTVSQEIGWKECPQNDLFFVKGNIKPELTNSVETF